MTPSPSAMNPLMTSSCEKYNEIKKKKKKKKKSLTALKTDVCRTALISSIGREYTADNSGHATHCQNTKTRRNSQSLPKQNIQLSSDHLHNVLHDMQSKAHNTIIQLFSINITSLGLFSLLHNRWWNRKSGKRGACSRCSLVYLALYPLSYLMSNTCR